MPGTCPNGTINIDRRVLVFFTALMISVNAAALLVPWKEIMAGSNDFPIFYSNAKMVREGQAAKLYDFDAENSFVHQVSKITRPPNNHLPYELLLFVPLTRLSFDHAFIVWTVLGFCMLACVALLMRDVRGRKPGFWWAFLGILAFYPVWYCLLQGQDSILLLLLFATSFWIWRWGREDLAGFALAFSLFRPQLALPFVFVMILARKWKFVLGFLPGAFLVGALSVWVVGWHGMAMYLHILIAQGTQGSGRILLHQWEIQPQLMPTWRGLLWICVRPWMTTSGQAILLLAGTLGGLWWAAKGVRAAKNGSASDLAFAIAIAMVVAVSFHSFLNDFSVAVLPLLFLATLISSAPGLSPSTAYWLVTIGFIFFLSPLYLLTLAANAVGLLAIAEMAALWTMAGWQRDMASAT